MQELEGKVPIAGLVDMPELFTRLCQMTGVAISNDTIGELARLSPYHPVPHDAPIHTSSSSFEFEFTEPDIVSFYAMVQSNVRVHAHLYTISDALSHPFVWAV